MQTASSFVLRDSEQSDHHEGNGHELNYSAKSIPGLQLPAPLPQPGLIAAFK
ncbi:hypothetical protein [Desulfosporosinus sp. SB140]|uniref:hypothetical protein n=1 Tax=Desulfosporosinus paludis TaxID=3115649 RepID=UPI003890BCC1